MTAVEQSFKFELDQLKLAIADASQAANEENLRQICQCSRAVFAAVEHWILAEQALPNDARACAVEAHTCALNLYDSTPIPSDIAYVRTAVQERADKLRTIDLASVQADLAAYLQ